MTIDLNKFCGKEACRSYLTVPWSAGEYSHATNGHIAVRIPRRPEFEECSNAPNIAKIYDEAGPVGRLSPLPNFIAPDPSPCPDCKGSGFILPCVECDGTGDATCSECGHQTECTECDDGIVGPATKGQEGADACGECDGIGSVDAEDARVEFAPNIEIKLCYARMLKELPNPRIDLTPREFAWSNAPVRFAFDGGDGLIMPMQVGGSKNIIKAESVTSSPPAA